MRQALATSLLLISCAFMVAAVVNTRTMNKAVAHTEETVRRADRIAWADATNRAVETIRWTAAWLLAALATALVGLSLQG